MLSFSKPILGCGIWVRKSMTNIIGVLEGFKLKRGEFATSIELKIFYFIRNLFSAMVLNLIKHTKTLDFSLSGKSHVNLKKNL